VIEYQIPILLVEDDRLDVKNVQRAFSQLRITNPLFVVGDGEQALRFLRNEPPFADLSAYPRPGLILLDINMPIMSGIEFLQQYKATTEFKSIPAVVLTTSDEERDLAESYDLGIAGYIVKPITFEDFVDVISRIDLYWSICSLPNRAGETHGEKANRKTFRGASSEADASPES